MKINIKKIQNVHKILQTSCISYRNHMLWYRIIRINGNFGVELQMQRNSGKWAAFLRESAAERKERKSSCDRAYIQTQAYNWNYVNWVEVCDRNKAVSKCAVIRNNCGETRHFPVPPMQRWFRCGEIQAKIERFIQARCSLPPTMKWIESHSVWQPREIATHTHTHSRTNIPKMHMTWCTFEWWKWHASRAHNFVYAFDVGASLRYCIQIHAS